MPKQEHSYAKQLLKRKQIESQNYKQNNPHMAMIKPLIWEKRLMCLNSYGIALLKVRLFLNGRIGLKNWNLWKLNWKNYKQRSWLIKNLSKMGSMKVNVQYVAINLVLVEKVVAVIAKKTEKLESKKNWRISKRLIMPNWRIFKNYTLKGLLKLNRNMLLPRLIWKNNTWRKRWR